MIVSSGHFGGFDGEKIVDVIEMCDIKNKRVEDIGCEDDISTCSFKSSCCE